MANPAARRFEPGTVTAVLPVFNEEPFISPALDSVVGQVERVIVVDNCSTDRTEEIVRKYAAKHENIHYSRNQENLGSSGNCRIGFQKVETEFSFFLGGHDYISQNYVSVLKEMLQDEPTASLAYTYAYYVDRDGNVGPGSDQASIRKQVAKNDVFRRAFAMAAYHGDCNLLNGLFRSTVAVPAFETMGSYAGCDHRILFEAALKGKMLYTDKAFYYRRVRSEDTMSAYMSRILGKAVVTEAERHSELDHVQLVAEMKALLRKIEYPDSIRKRFWFAMINRVLDEGFLQVRPEKRFFLNFLRFVRTITGPDFYRSRNTRKKLFADIYRFLASHVTRSEK